ELRAGPPGAGPDAGPDAPLDLAEVRWDVSVRGDEERFTWTTDVITYGSASSGSGPSGLGDVCGSDLEEPEFAGIFDYLGHTSPPRELPEDAGVQG
ncbi:MAG: hypothetical protein R3320_10250, partial [Nitriliruptorales bacterium]|nr:hypothetical protein [Nitriliruptorales bacterium]